MLRLLLPDLSRSEFYTLVLCVMLVTYIALSARNECECSWEDDRAPALPLTNIKVEGENNRTEVLSLDKNLNHTGEPQGRWAAVS